MFVVRDIIASLRGFLKMLYPLLRPLLFCIDPETVHHLTMISLQMAYRCRLSWLLGGRPQPYAQPIQVMGLDFPHPVGLAAGLDKNGAYIDALAALGFAFIEIGTITPRPQAGNPKKRLFRLPQAQAIINRMGFNNQGVDALVENVKRAKFKGILGINIGKNADTPIENAVDDYLICLRKVYTHASYVAVNISSPNTKNLRSLQGGDALDDLLRSLKAEQLKLAEQHGRYVPIALKIAPDLDAEQIQAVAQALLSHQFDAVIATNTTLARDAVQGLPHADEAGGLSGAPVTQKSNEVIAALHQQLGTQIPIIGVGGVMSGADAHAKKVAGAQLVQLYSGIVYSGPPLIKQCAKAWQAS